MKKFSISIICLAPMFFINLNAQDISEMRVLYMGEFLPYEIIAVDNVDANGKVCAGLIVASDLTDLSYDSNDGIIKFNKRPGADLLYLSPNERVVTIYKTGFIALKIILDDYGINLESGKVWQIKITGDKKNEKIPVTIITNVENTRVIIDNDDKGHEKTHWLTIGKHILVIVNSGYDTIKTQIEVNKKNIYFKYDMVKLTPLKYTILTEPKGAIVFINNSIKGKSDYQDFEFPGKYQLKLTKPEHLDLNADIEITNTQDNIFIFNLTKNRGLLKLNIIPNDAEVKLDGESVSEMEIELPPKSYEIEISRIGYYTIKDTIEVKLGEILTENHTLEKSTSELNLTIEPADAKVTINKKDYTCQKVIDMVPGNYLIEIEKEGYRKIEEVISLELRQTLSKTFTLQPRTGSLQYTVKPIDAKIELRKKGAVVKNWEGANFLNDLMVGEYIIIVYLHGRTTEKKITISENSITVIDMVLELTELQGEIFVTVTPDEASNSEIFVNKESKGFAPLTISLLPGYYKITAKKPDFPDAFQNINVAEKSKQNISLNMVKTGNDSKTLNWITTGSTLVGGVLATYFYLDSKDNFNKYNAATTQSAAIDYKSKTENSTRFFNITLSLSTVALVASVVLWIIN
ncbi:MAG: PEGA domain-containing protein [bacterium]